MSVEFRRHFSMEGPIAFAERVLRLLDEASFTATYKYAVLLALLDLCMEKVAKGGQPAEVFTTLELAEKIAQLYWDHTLPFYTGSRSKVLRQFAGRPGAQAKIIRHIEEFRARYAKDPSARLKVAREESSGAYLRMLRRIEWELIEDPLPRLQRTGAVTESFLYTINWDTEIWRRRREVTAYQRGEPSDFDNRIMLRPGVGLYLVQLNGLLRPIIQRRWAAMVARLNRLEEARLEEFLFGAEREAVTVVCAPLRELQDDRCFYCDRKLGRVQGRRPQVDHFIPWARYPNNAIENLVVADERCNGNKGDHLAASGHLERWKSRLDPESHVASQLAEIATRLSWDADPTRSVSIARAVYFPLPEGYPLWLLSNEVEPLDPGLIWRLLS
ncbi:MAG: HNH endonuclease [Gemmatimonadales bacterium]|nr:MAG: HNH endonuclease [Gemmatimonadales bacterium]